MTLDAHPEIMGTAAVVGALALMVVRQVIAWRLNPQQPAWPWLGITSCGMAFAITRIVHLSSPSQDISLLMIRLQYAIGMLLPGLGMATVEVLTDRPISRATKIAIGGAVPLQLVCVVTPFLVRGPLELHRDLFGQPYYGAHTGWMVIFILPIAIAALAMIRRRVSAMPVVLGQLRRGFRIGALVFALAALHDSLVGAGVFRSVFVLEYAFVVFGVIAANFDLRRAAIIQYDMAARLAAKRVALDEQEARLARANQRLDRSTTRYRHLADATHEGVVLCSGTRVLDVNRALCKMLSTSAARVREPDIRGFELSRVIAEGDRIAVARLINGEDGPIEVALLREDGSQLPISVKAMAPPDNSLGTRVLLVRDISAERSLQRRLATADRLAAVGTLAAGTAHEINNPLAFIVANADMLEESALAPDHREMVVDIKTGAYRIRDVVRDLMSLARDRGDDTKAIDVAEVVRRCIAMASPQTRHRTRVTTAFERMLPVRANEGRLFQVFLNLIVNAAQAIREGNVDNNCIAITGRSERGLTIIEVSDTGDGMPQHVLERIFEPFFTTKEIGHGTGLGLSISHGIVTDLGGRIDVTSQLGKGTTFRVTIPTTEEREPEITGPIQKTEVAPRLRVLIIDDEVAFARSLARMLDAHDVDIAQSGRIALEHLANKDYDVALCDIMMPDVTGIQLYEQLVQQHDPVAGRFLFMTGGVFSADAQRFLDEIGAGRWVAKPIAMTDLRRMVSDIGAR